MLDTPKVRRHAAIGQQFGVMTLGRSRRNRALARGLATAGAVLLLFAQLLMAAHFHEGVASRGGIAAAQLSADRGICAVCELAFHSPGSVAAAPTLSRGPAPADSIVLPDPIALDSPVLSPERGRAPPVSL
ncbi:MAG TPA: hypothetical protein VEU51_13705 [Candidatus Acidoferrales bacterium]|nr:hypothetical protein [Candidatus Acidoferrales bacterium]